MDRIVAALLEPFVDPGSRTHWMGLTLTVLVAVAWHAKNGRFRWRDLWHPSSRLDVQLLLAHQLLSSLGWLPVAAGGLWLATHGVRWLDATVGDPGWTAPALGLMVAYTLVLFVAWDLSRYVLHRLMHEVPLLWPLHQVHHSAEVLTPLTFHRIHPVESLLYGLRGALVTGVVSGLFYWAFRGQAVEWTILGVHGVGWVLNTAHGNLRHSHVWIDFGPLERWLVSPAQHQLHHALGHDRVNYGTWLAIWDRVAGSWASAQRTQPDAYGLDHTNHDHDLLSAWFGPLRGMVRVLVPLILLMPLSARAQDETPEADLEIIVEAEGGKPRVAGSAHVVDEEALEQFEHDDIHAVLAEVPGVYVRGEDGFGLRPNIGIRGANADRSAKITLLEDGVLLAPAPYSAPAAYYFPMVTRMAAVEVFKGPAAIGHGPQTVGGAINLVTRRPPDHTTGQVDLGVGLRNTRKLHAWAGGSGDSWGFLAEGVYLGSDGFKQLDGGGPTGFDRGEVMVRAHSAGLELKLGYGRELSNETYLGLHVDDYAKNPYRRYAASQAGQMAWNRTLVELAWPVSIGEVDLRTVAYHHGMHRVWTKFNRFNGGPDIHALLQQPEAGANAVFLAILRGKEDSVTNDQTLLIGTNDRTFESAGVQTRGRWTRYGSTVSSRLDAGLRLHHDFIDRLHTEDPFEMRSGQLVAEEQDTEILVFSRSSATALAGHVLEDLEISGFHIIPGGRIEVIETSQDDLGSVLRTVGLPGLGLLAEVTPELDVFAGTHRGFSPVPPGEAADVQPESSWNVEGGARLGRDANQVEAIGYLNHYTNITGQCTFSGGCLGDDLDRQFNGGRALLYGAETSASVEWLAPERITVPIEATYTFTTGFFRTEFVSGFPQFGTVRVGDFFPYVPRHQGSLRLSVAHPRGRIGAALHARSGMLDEAGPLPVPEEAGVPGLTTLDLAADAPIVDGLLAYVTATNVTGAAALVSWRPFGARPPAPFQLMVGVKVTPGP